jgi:hypothetical protein
MAAVAAAHPQVLPYLAPLPLGAILGSRYSESDAGRAFWQAADELGQASTCIYGCAPGLQPYITWRAVGLTPKAQRQACQAMAEALP